MGKVNPSILVASFGTDTEVGGFEKTLSRLNYQPEILLGSTWLTTPAQRTDDPLILFFGSRHYPRHKVLQALDSLRATSSLGVFCSNRTSWDPAIAYRCGEFVSWPCESHELAFRLRRIYPTSCGEETCSENDQFAARFVRFNLLGRSPPFLQTLQLLARLAPLEAPVFIIGETGTGKELSARAIHCLSKRRNFPFVPVNCAGIPDTLVENELFGHAKGAYTDANEAERGLVTQAQGGTLFLDEVEVLSAKAQGTLLRFLQDLEYRPLGSGVSRKADVRLIAATNVSLGTLVEREDFRKDLLYRLNVLSLQLPPLRNRPGDIALLAGEFVRRFSAKYSEPIKNFHPRTLVWMQDYSWPGNIRELENVIHRAFVTTAGNEIQIDDGFMTRGLADQSTTAETRFTCSHKNFNRAKAEAIAQFERQYLDQLMTETHGNVTLAARLGGKERRALGKLLRKHGIDRHRYLLTPPVSKAEQ